MGFSQKKIFILCLINSIVTLGCVCFLFKESRQEKIVYVNNTAVFEGFRMTIEMKTIGEKELKQRKKHIDSLYVILNNPANKSTNESIMREFINEKQELENFNELFSSQESKKIWERINNYAKDFSSQNNYEIILGMQPNGNIIFGKENREITNEFLAYINKKYEGSE